MSYTEIRNLHVVGALIVAGTMAALTVYTTSAPPPISTSKNPLYRASNSHEVTTKVARGLDGTESQSTQAHAQPKESPLKKDLEISPAALMISQIESALALSDDQRTHLTQRLEKEQDFLANVTDPTERPRLINSLESLTDILGEENAKAIGAQISSLEG